ncbi:MAG: transaldolase [Arsenophonus sp.]|nr:MAG: transaldolase [Arsenophonus sp.]
MTNTLSFLKKNSKIAADTADINIIKFYKPEDVTTNPSLILLAIKNKQYEHLLDEAILWAKKKTNSYSQQIIDSCDKLLVNIGSNILKYIPGKISIEIDARLSYNTSDSVNKARHIINLYNRIGIKNERILIKLASTWEGIRAAEQLEKEGIHCNLTLVFSLHQAYACAEAGVFIVSPFVGRIFDWYQKQNNKFKKYDINNDPGVLFLMNVFNIYKKYHFKTNLMGASFRNMDEILQLSGCDYLTIPPYFLKKLSLISKKVTCNLKFNEQCCQKPVPITKLEFDLKHRTDQLASNQLKIGIYNFIRDQEKLEKIISQRLSLF